MRKTRIVAEACATAAADCPVFSAPDAQLCEQQVAAQTCVDLGVGIVACDLACMQ